MLDGKIVAGVDTLMIQEVLGKAGYTWRGRSSGHVVKDAYFIFLRGGVMGWGAQRDKEYFDNDKLPLLEVVKNIEYTIRVPEVKVAVRDIKGSYTLEELEEIVKDMKEELTTHGR